MSEIGDVLVQNLTEATLSWQVHQLLATRFWPPVLSLWGRYAGFCSWWDWPCQKSMKESHWVLRAVILRLILEPSGLGWGGWRADFTSQQKGCQVCACQMAMSVVLKTGQFHCVWLKNRICGLGQDENKEIIYLIFVCMWAETLWQFEKSSFQSWKSQRANRFADSLVRNPAIGLVAVIPKGGRS